MMCVRCGSYPGLYTDVARYVDWISNKVAQLENEVRAELSESDVERFTLTVAGGVVTV